MMIKDQNIITLKIIFIITVFFFSTSAQADLKDILIPQIDTENIVKETLRDQENPIKKTELQPQKQIPQKTNQADTNSLNDDLSKHNSNAPVYFSGNNGVVSKKTGTINLKGNVTITQDNTTLTSDNAQIIAKSGSVTLSGSTNIQRATATGNVHVYKKSSVNTQEIRAQADSLEFLVPEHIMVLKGKAQVKKGAEFINAEAMKINLTTGDINLEQPHGTIDPRSASSLSSKRGKYIEN